MHDNVTDIDALATTLANGLSLDDLRQRQFRNPYERPTQRSAEMVEKERSYWDKVRGDRPPTLLEGLRFGRVFEQEMPYETARKKFWAAMKMQAATVAMRDNNPEFDWIVDDDLANNLRNMVKWAINDPTCDIPLHKGLFLFGNTGVGKTDFLETLQRFMRTNALSKQFVITQMSDVYTKAREDKDYQPVQQNIQHDRAFDEFGRHTGPVMRYGDALDINEAVVEARYLRFRRYGQITHFVANMTPNECKQAFSPMVYDRIRHMCGSLHFTGESRRR